MAGDPRPYIISLAYSRADESLARMVRKSLRAAANVFEQGVGLRNNNPFPPVNMRVLLVTNRLTADEWRGFEDSPDAGRLYLLMAPTRVPAEWVARSSKVQWVDLRRGVFQLGWVLLYLRNVQKARLEYAANCIPVRFDSLKGPNGLAALAQAVNIVAAWTMACGMLALVSPAQTQSISRFLPLAVLLGIWQFSIVHTLYQRSRTLVQFGCELMASLLLGYGTGVYDLIMKAAPVNSSYSAGIPFLFDSKYIVLSAGLVAASTALVFWNLSGCRFPAKGAWRATAGSPTHGAIAKSQLHYLLIAVGVTVYLLANRA